MNIKLEHKAYIATLLGLVIAIVGLLVIPEKKLVDASYPELAFLFALSLGPILIFYGFVLAHQARIVVPLLLGTFGAGAIVLSRDGSEQRFMWIGAVIVAMTILGLVELHLKGRLTRKSARNQRK